MRTKRSSKTAAAAAPENHTPVVDFPREGEKITSTTYSFRISAPTKVGPVEVSLNKGRWLSCRQEGEHWWYDWASVAPGKYRLRARAHCGFNGKAKMKNTLLRRFLVAAS